LRFERFVACASQALQVVEDAMRFLRDFYLGLDPVDRATALIALILSTAIALSFAALVRSYAAESSLAPSITAPPFEMRFA
jgi:hypothetical protein